MCCTTFYNDSLCFSLYLAILNSNAVMYCIVTFCSVPYTISYILYALYILYCILYTVCTVYCILYVLYTVYCLYPMMYTVCTVYPRVHRGHNRVTLTRGKVEPCSVTALHCALAMCTVHCHRIVQCALFIVTTLCSVHCSLSQLVPAVKSAHGTNLLCCTWG